MIRFVRRGGGTSGTAVAALLTATCLLGGCRVLTLDQDRMIRSRQGGSLDAASYVAALWSRRAVPALDAAAVPIATLMPAIAADLDRAGAVHGRRAGEGSAWTFVVSGTGRVESVDGASPRGQIVVAMPGMGQSVRLQIGPVVEGSAVRDALPFVTFDDFADQIAFADVGRALTARALAGVRPVVAALRPGQAIRFTGVANVRDAAAPLVVTPIALAADRAG